MTTPDATRTILVDGHVHLHPGHDWAGMVQALLDHLQAPTPDAVTIRVGLLAESRGCSFYRDVLRSPAAFRQGSLHLEVPADGDAIIIRDGTMIAGYLIPGRQIVTQERLEVLALGADVTVDDGLAVEPTLAAIWEQGALPVLSWSPGKWFFARGKRVSQLIEDLPPGSFLIGDTAMRPTFWPVPRLMQRARLRGFRIIGGSDPLPLPGEESMVGTYGMSLSGAFDPAKPAASLKTLLADPLTVLTTIGQRSAPIAFLSRWIRNQTLRKG